MKYKVVEKAYPDNPDALKKQYANPVNRVVTKINVCGSMFLKIDNTANQIEPH